MKNKACLLLIAAFLFLSTIGIAQTYYAKSSNGINLRGGPGTGHSVITTIPHNGEMKVINKSNGEWWQVDYKGQTGYVSAQNLSEEKTRNTNSSRNHNNNQNRNTNNHQRSSARSASAGYYGYTTALGLRGGYTSGISLKHFVNNNGAVELVLGSRWHGFSLTALYEFHKGNALGVPGLSWEYGIGGRVGFYNGRYYYRGYKDCRDPYNPKCSNYYYYHNPTMTAVGIVGIGGLEYNFREIPLTLSVDLMPNFYFYHYRGTFWDGSMSLRYILK